MLNVVYLLMGWSPVSRESGSCKLNIFILTLLGRRGSTGRAWTLQCGRIIIELSGVTMADFIVLLCNWRDNCRILAGIKLDAKNICTHRFCV